MKINLAHIRHPAASGGYIDFVLFEAKSSSGSSGNPTLLNQLTLKAKANGLKVDQSALAYMENGHLRYFGDKNLVQFLKDRRPPAWNYKIDV